MTRKLEYQGTIFPLTNENLLHTSSPFVGLGLNPPQKPCICLVTSSNVHGLELHGRAARYCCNVLDL